MNDKKRTRLAIIVAVFLAIWCFQPDGLAKSAFGQFGFQQQENARLQLQNHGAERMMAIQQRAFINRQNQDCYYTGTQAGRGYQYSNNSARSQTVQRYEAPIQVGDDITVLYSSTPVKIGETTIAVLNAGTKLTVIERQGNWIGVRIQKDESPVTGWIYMNNVRIVNR